MSKWLMALLIGVVLPCQAQGVAQPGEPRELIYCADQMSHEEREAYRAKMRAARSADEKAAIRQAHRQEMQEKARQSGREGQCEPTRQRQRERGGQ